MLRSVRIPLLFAVGACASAPPGEPPKTPLKAEGAPGAPLAWAQMTPATFAKAKAEHKFVVLDGSAEWCHWCHVMEATTYHDPAVRALLDARFIAVKVDIDERADIGERYGDWGWPATVIFSPDAKEIGKYRGYIAPPDFVEILKAVVAGEDTEARAKIQTTPLVAPRGKLTDAELSYIERDTELSLDEYYDEDQGGWGRTQKVPIPGDNQWAILRATQGDAVMKARILFTLSQQAGVIDPVWGGVYQYSIGHDWTKPHFEKLMPFEAGALENYATAYALTGDTKLLATAEGVHRYLDGFMLSKEGGFYATQDADVNAHDPTKPFVSGHDYYVLDDAGRRAKGIPRVDTHEYGRENGLAIAAYVTLFQATCVPARAPGACDKEALATAERAAARVIATHKATKDPRGIAHDADPATHVLYLADNAAFGYALARLYEATHNESYLEGARKIAELLSASFRDPETGALFGSTVDPDAVGVFSQRRIPFEDNVTAIRLFVKLAELSGPPASPKRIELAAAAERTLEGIARPAMIRGQGRMLGYFLLAMEDVRRMRAG